MTELYAESIDPRPLLQSIRGTSKQKTQGADKLTEVTPVLRNEAVTAREETEVASALALIGLHEVKAATTQENSKAGEVASKMSRLCCDIETLAALALLEKVLTGSSESLLTILYNLPNLQVHRLCYGKAKRLKRNTMKCFPGRIWAMLKGS